MPNFRFGAIETAVPPDCLYRPRVEKWALRRRGDASRLVPTSCEQSLRGDGAMLPSLVARRRGPAMLTTSTARIEGAVPIENLIPLDPFEIIINRAGLV